MQSIIEYKEKQISIEVPKGIEVLSGLLEEYGEFFEDDAITSDKFFNAYHFLQDFYIKVASRYFKKQMIDCEFMEKEPNMGTIVDYAVVYDLQDLE